MAALTIIVITCGRCIYSVRKTATIVYGIFASTGIAADVTLVIKKKEFPAHKAILAARSTVFAAMFQHDMREAASNRVGIVEIEPDIFQAVLRFIYTDQVDLTIEKLQLPTNTSSTFSSGSVKSFWPKIYP